MINIGIVAYSFGERTKHSFQQVKIQKINPLPTTLPHFLYQKEYAASKLLNTSILVDLFLLYLFAFFRS
ncbi:hypothetical protein LJC62_04615, partial [Odoribacter sp. OttesenSCG-928-A06]|nr:hypothetical protein [Odoribacter sp. OttesenSCG-928-A06]